MFPFRTAKVVALLGTVACVPESTTQYVMGDVEFAAPAGSGEPNLVHTSDDAVVLTWLEEVERRRWALKIASRKNGSWSPPLTVKESDRFFANWADFPSFVEQRDGTWVVHWLEKTAANTYAYHVKLAISKDRGETWSEPIVPHRDDSPREHGFVSMVPWQTDGVALVWLDGRNMTSADGADERGDMDTGEMSLRATTLGPGGALGPDVLIDERTCECCQTALAVTSRGLIAAYRDRSDSEIRNIAVARMENGVWSEPTPVHDDGWYYPGCPVNGPQLSAAGDTVAVAWFTAPEQKTATYVAYSMDGGETFGAPIRVDDGDPLGRVDVELLDHGAALVVWLERTKSAAAIRARVVHPDGTADAAWNVAMTSESRGSGFPRMARVGSEVVFAWTLVGPDGGVRVATARVGG